MLKKSNLINNKQARGMNQSKSKCSWHTLQNIPESILYRPTHDGCGQYKPVQARKIC